MPDTGERLITPPEFFNGGYLSLQRIGNIVYFSIFFYALDLNDKVDYTETGIKLFSSSFIPLGFRAPAVRKMKFGLGYGYPDPSKPIAPKHGFTTISFDYDSYFYITENYTGEKIYYDGFSSFYLSGDYTTLDVFPDILPGIPVPPLVNPYVGESISGTGFSGNTVIVKDENGVLVGMTIINSDSTWNVLPITLLKSGDILSVIQKDIFGNSSTESYILVH